MEIQIILAIIGSGLISTFIVVLNDWVKYKYSLKMDMANKVFKIRETINKEFLKNIDFLYTSDYLTPEDQLRKKHNFLKTYRMMFLYSEDDEVKTINNMMDVLINAPSTDDALMMQKKRRIAKSFLSLRKHVISDTKLTTKDFKHIT